jgi:hypothetical protein
MKPLPWLFTVSVAANLGLLVWGLRSKPPAPPASPAPAMKSPASAGDAAAALRAALVSGDTAALAAAGVPPDAIRAFTIGRAFDVYQGRMRALRPVKDDRYWRTPVVDFAQARERRLAESKAEQDFSEAVRTTYGENYESLFNGGNQALAALPPEKRERMRQIERDYAEMEQLINADKGSGIQLPSDRDRLKLLSEEKERDIAALLTPAERELIALRDPNSWSTAGTVRWLFGDVLKTEEEYKRVFALQKAFDERFPYEDGPQEPAQREPRLAAERKLMEDMRVALGPERWAEAERASDPDASIVDQLTRRLNLDPKVTDTVLALRTRYADESIRINSNLALSFDERSAQIKALAATAEADITATLGPGGGAAFMQNTSWVRWMRNGQAFSVDPKGLPLAGRPLIGTRAYPIMPQKMPPRP